MRVHISRIYNMGGAARASQWKTLSVAKELGFQEMSIFHFGSDWDSDVELSKRLDGTFAGVWHGDIVILQLPTWNEIRYEFNLVTRLKYAYSGLKLVIFLHDVIPLMFNSGDDLLQKMIEIYNYADLIIAPSQEMLVFLRERGLTVKKQMVQEIWDYKTEFEGDCPMFCKRIFFVGNKERFPFIERWNYATPLELYGWDGVGDSNLNVEFKGYKKELRLLSELSEGGYGLVWSSEESNNYYKMLQPYKVATYLNAGIPIIIQKGLVSEEIILKNRLGFAVETLEEADAIVQNTTEAEYNEMVKRIAEFNFLIKNGWFTKKLLTDAVMWLLNDNFQPNTAVAAMQKERHSIKVKGIHDTLDYIIQNGCSVARFGDGEMNLISGLDIPYQIYDASLAKYLKEIIGMQSSDKMLVCLPDVFEGQNRYNEFSRNFWKEHLEQYGTWYDEICQADWYGSTFISRPYIDLLDKSESAGYFEHLKLLWKDREILIVEGYTSRVGVGNDLFADANSINRIICPSKDAWSQYGEILDNIIEYGENRLILIMLGPTAKVLAYELSMRGYQAIDLGHVDSEYEWFRMGAECKVKLPNKHTAEHNHDENIIFDESLEYEKQIVCSCVRE